MIDATLSYIELPAVDLAASKSFYGEHFGWEWTDYGPTYAGTFVGALEIGLSTESPVAQSHAPGEQAAIGPFILWKTDDLDAALAAFGGADSDAVITAPYSFPGGRRFHVTDPSGNTIGIYQYD